jgi:hypothetical protein
MSEPDIAGVMAAAMTSENRRRELAAQSPGLGALLSIEQPVAAAAVGKSGLDMPVIGEGYEMTAPGALQHKSYGPPSPQYAPDVVGGLGFQAGKSEPAISVYLGQRSTDAAVVVSPPARPSLWRRLLRRG